MYVSARRFVYFFVVFFALNGLIGVLDVDTRMKRQLVAILYTAAICTLAWWARPSRLRRPVTNVAEERREILLIRLSVAVLMPVLIANVFGFMLLSHLLRFPVLLCACFGFILYTAVRVSNTLFAALLRVPRVSSLASVRLHEAGLVRWSDRLVTFAAALCWSYLTLHLLQADEAFSER